MGAKKLYAMYVDGVKEGEFSSREIRDRWGIRQETISDRADTGALYKGRYLFEVVCDGAEAREDPLLKEWDEVRLKILGAGRNISGN